MIEFQKCNDFLPQYDRPYTYEEISEIKNEIVEKITNKLTELGMAHDDTATTLDLTRGEARFIRLLISGPLREGIQQLKLVEELMQPFYPSCISKENFRQPDGGEK